MGILNVALDIVTIIVITLAATIIKKALKNDKDTSKLLFESQKIVRELEKDLNDCSQKLHEVFHVIMRINASKPNTNDNIVYIQDTQKLKVK